MSTELRKSTVVSNQEPALIFSILFFFCVQAWKNDRNDSSKTVKQKLISVVKKGGILGVKHLFCHLILFVVPFNSAEEGAVVRREREREREREHEK